MCLLHLLVLPYKLHKKIRFRDEDELKGFSFLLRSGYAVKMFQRGIYGVTSPKQIQLLDNNGIQYTMV